MVAEDQVKPVIPKQMKEVSPTQTATTASTRSALTAGSYDGSFSFELSPKTPSTEISLQQVRVIVAPGDDSWEGRVEVDVSPESTLGDVKAAVAELVHRPDILKDGKLIRVKDNGDKMVLKETAALGKRRTVFLAGADGLQWPPKPMKVKVTDLGGNSAVVAVRMDATIFQVKQVLAEKFDLPDLIETEVGIRDATGRFMPLGNNEGMGARRMFIMEGEMLADTSPVTPKNSSAARLPLTKSPTEGDLWMYARETQHLIKQQDVVIETMDYY